MVDRPRKGRATWLSGRARYSTLRPMSGTPTIVLDGSAGELLVAGVLRAAEVTQEVIEAAQVRERHVDLGHRGQLLGPSR